MQRLEDMAIQRKPRLVPLSPPACVGSTSTTSGPILIDSTTTSQPAFFYTRKMARNSPLENNFNSNCLVHLDSLIAKTFYLVGLPFQFASNLFLLKG